MHTTSSFTYTNTPQSTHTPVMGKHLPPFFCNAAYLCPSVIPLLIWLLLFIVSHAISALHLALFLWTLVLRVTTIICKCVGGCVYLPHFFTSVSVCDFFSVFFLSFFLNTLSQRKLCQAKDQSGADAHTCDVSADPCLRVRWQLSISVTCWFILLSSPPIRLHPTPSPPRP